MEILLLGTGAADGIPSYFSGSRVSEYARKHGGRDVRTRTAALVDGTIKIDFPPDTFAQCVRENLDPKDWTAIVFTHSDDDHLALREMQYAFHPFTDRLTADFTIYANDHVCTLIETAYPNWPLEVIRSHSFQSFKHLDYIVTPISATHLATEDSQNLILQRDGKTLLYATDTGIYSEETYAFLKDFPLDILIIECTDGFNDSGYAGHLDLHECLQMVEEMGRRGTVTPKTLIATTHHSHNGNATYEELREALKTHGIIAGYDGLRLKV